MELSQCYHTKEKLYLFSHENESDSEYFGKILVPRNNLLSALSLRWLIANCPTPCLVFLVPVKNVTCCGGRLCFTANVTERLDIAFLLDRHLQLPVT